MPFWAEKIPCWLFTTLESPILLYLAQSPSLDLLLHFSSQPTSYLAYLLCGMRDKSELARGEKKNNRKWSINSDRLPFREMIFGTWQALDRKNVPNLNFEIYFPPIYADIQPPWFAVTGYSMHQLCVRSVPSLTSVVLLLARVVGRSWAYILALAKVTFLRKKCQMSLWAQSMILHPFSD